MVCIKKWISCGDFGGYHDHVSLDDVLVKLGDTYMHYKVEPLFAW
jgi:hypothetical protein